MVEEQVQVEVPLPYGHALLPGDEGEVGAQLQLEPLQLPENGRLQVPLAVGVCEPQEVQEIGIPEDQIGRHAIRLLPTAWQYEWMEAFLHILGREELIFSDYENNAGKKRYSRVGGCYYSCKMAVLEALAREKKQAGAIVLREAYPGYVPLGVFSVRENVRNAMSQPAQEFESMKTALQYISARLELPIKRFIERSDLLQEQLRSRQTTLSCFS